MPSMIDRPSLPMQPASLARPQIQGGWSGLNPVKTDQAGTQLAPVYRALLVPASAPFPARARATARAAHVLRINIVASREARSVS